MFFHFREKKTEEVHQTIVVYEVCTRWMQAQTVEMRATVAGMKETVAALHTEELLTKLTELKDSIQGHKDSDDGAVSKADLRRELRSFATTLSEQVTAPTPLAELFGDRHNTAY